MVTEQGRLSVSASLSRAGECAVVAVGVGVDVGIDVERVAGLRADGPDSLEKVAWHPHEQPRSLEDRARLWVRKESVLKLLGLGLTVDPRRLRLSDADRPPEVLDWGGLDPAGTTWMWDLVLGDGYVGSLAVLADDCPHVSVVWAGPGAPADEATGPAAPQPPRQHAHGRTP
jgi:hypothetical protein